MMLAHQENKHSVSCRQRSEAASQAQKAYQERWPAHCQTCDGWGEIEVNDEIDLCGDCLVEDRCPRCACAHFYQDCQSICPNCNWMIGIDDGCPFEPECCCEKGEDTPLK